ncbi:MAG: DNA polymerase III subunit gamma/tau [Chloroflexota bacterium]|nr:DNA polymerase III subunit gamma/tau [Chloroflexota bacterium]
MSQALYLKWRPQTFDDVIGQEHIIRTLRNALQLERVHHAYLFAGPRGTGKTTTARLIAKAVNCVAPVAERPCGQCEICRAVDEARLMDLIEIDAASHTGVDSIRELLEKVNFRPVQAHYKVYVIDEVHMLSPSAFNALLKTLEEPPAHVIFVLATTEVHKVPATVLSRCQRFEFRRIPLADITQRLQKICSAEKIEAEPQALALIARAATGSLRDAISLLDQMASSGTVRADYVRQILGAERREVVQTLIRTWLDQHLEAGIRTINEALDGGADPRQLAKQLTDFLRGLLLMRLGAGETWHEPTNEERPQLQKLAQRATPAQLVRAVRLFSDVASERRSGWQPQLSLELAFIAATHPPQPVPVIPAGQSVPQENSPRRPAHIQSSPTPTSTLAKRSLPEPAPAAVPAGGDPSLVREISSQWKKILHYLSAPLRAPLWSAEPLAVDAEGALVLGFRHTFHRNKAQESSVQPLEAVLGKMFNQQIQVRCVLKEEWTPARTKPTSSPQSKPTPHPTQPSAPPAPPQEQEDLLVKRAVAELGAVAREIHQPVSPQRRKDAKKNINLS